MLLRQSTAGSLDASAAAQRAQLTAAKWPATSGCDLGDEREVLRTLPIALPDGQTTQPPNDAIEPAREIRATNVDLQHL